MPPPPPSNNVVHVRPLVGTAWLIQNWRFVVSVALASVLPLWLIVRRWRASSQRAQALFDFTFAESLRARGNASGISNSIVHYDKILKHSCPTQLIWRCHSGRSMALLSRGDTSRALADANQAIQLAEELQRQAQAQKEKMDKQKAKNAAASAAAAAAGGSVATSSPPASSASASASDPDLDPFLSLPEVSLARLHYQRGLVLDAMRERAAALDDMRRAVALEPDMDFVTGYVARRELAQRVRGEGPDDNAQAQGSKGGDSTSSSSSSTSSSREATEAKQRTAPAATKPRA